MTADVYDEPLKEWRVAHYQQKYHWDCGLSCCIMVLPDHHKDHLMTNFSKIVEEEGFGESTWTIDLCYLLYRFEVAFSYFTVTFGIDPGYSRENFYDKVHRAWECMVSRDQCLWTISCNISKRLDL
jgi:hypothetical protein